MADARSAARVPPPIVFVAALAAQRIITRHKPATGLSRAAAAALLASSGALAVSAVSALTRAGTEIGPGHPQRATSLVTDGPFARTRNPVYLALAGVLLSRAVAHRSVLALVPAVGFVAVLSRTQVPDEERALESLFKRKYRRYSRAVPRWAGFPGA